MHCWRYLATQLGADLIYECNILKATSNRMLVSRMPKIMPRGMLAIINMPIICACEDLTSLGRLYGKRMTKNRINRHCLYSAVVVNDHMYPRPYIIFDSKGVIET